MSKDRFKKLPPEKEMRRNVTRQVVSDYLLMALAIDSSSSSSNAAPAGASSSSPSSFSSHRLTLMQSKGNEMNL
jgi:hypothetical protein